MKGGFVKGKPASLSATLPSKQTRLFLGLVPGIVLLYINGVLVLGKATIQSHSQPIEDLNFLLNFFFWLKLSSRMKMVLCLTCEVPHLRLCNVHLSISGNKLTLVERLHQYEVRLWPGSSGFIKVQPVMLPTAASHDSSESLETPLSGEEDPSSSAAVRTGLVPVPSTLGGSYKLLEPCDMAVDLSSSQALHPDASVLETLSQWLRLGRGRSGMYHGLACS